MERAGRTSGAIKGTLGYMSPEMARGGRLDQRSDLYAIGCLGYQMLTGQLPFPGQDPVAIIQAHLNQVPTPPSELKDDIDPTYERIILRLMQKEPLARYQSAFDVLEEMGIEVGEGGGVDDENIIVHAVPRAQAPAWLAALGGAPLALADTPGLVVARTLAMLVNEAADAVLQGVCTPEGADAAMKLGVNYPAGPFEWLSRWGAGGIVGTVAARNAPADGHSFLLSTNSTHAANVSLYAKLGYDPIKDFEPVGMFGKFGTVLMTRSAGPLDSLQALIDFARRNPNKLTFGYYSSSSQVPAELLKARAQIDVVGASYKNITQIITDLIGGRVGMLFTTALSAAPHMKAGRVRAVAVTSAKRNSMLPDVPTMAETLPGYDLAALQGIVVRSGTPRAVVDRIGRDLREVVNLPDVRARLEAEGADVIASTPEQFAATLRREMATWSQIVKDSGAKAE
jgi:tripartite-type tricarboxylate transporter receptor subunit TctC